MPMKPTITAILLALLLSAVGPAMADIRVDLDFADLPAIVQYSADGGDHYTPLATGENTIPGEPTLILLKIDWSEAARARVGLRFSPIAPDDATNWSRVTGESLPFGELLSCSDPSGDPLTDIAILLDIKRFPADGAFTPEAAVWPGRGSLTFAPVRAEPALFAAIDGKTVHSLTLSPDITIPATVLRQLDPGDHTLTAYYMPSGEPYRAEATITIPGSAATPSGGARVSGVKGFCNARSGPGTGHPVVGTAADGSALTVLGRESGWVNVTFTDRLTGETREGWIAGNFVAE